MHIFSAPEVEKTCVILHKSRTNFLLAEMRSKGGDEEVNDMQAYFCISIYPPLTYTFMCFPSAAINNAFWDTTKELMLTSVGVLFVVHKS